VWDKSLDLWKNDSANMLKLLKIENEETNLLIYLYRHEILTWNIDDFCLGVNTMDLFIDGEIELWKVYVVSVIFFCDVCESILKPQSQLICNHFILQSTKDALWSCMQFNFHWKLTLNLVCKKIQL